MFSWSYTTVEGGGEMRRSCVSVVAVCLLSTASLQADAQDAASAKAFVTDIYRHYMLGGKGIAVNETARYFHSSLQKLLEEDLRLTNDKKNPSPEIGTIDADYFLDAQEYDDISDLRVDVTLDKAGRAIANVSMTIFAPQNRSGDPERDQRHLRMILVVEQGKWRVWDLIFLLKGQKPDSFRAGLIRDIEANKKALKEAQQLR
jgi:hypothetical protein